MAFAVFGPGSLYVTRTDIANATPINIGYAQEFSLDQSGESKELFGQNQYPLVVARGTIKVTGKAKAAQLSAIALNNAFYGESGFSTGQLLAEFAEEQTVPATPFEITINPPGAGVFDNDLGVLNATTGLPYERVQTAAATGQYSVNEATGVYTFDTTDEAEAILISYAYTLAGSGQMITITNKVIGTTPTFQLDYATSLNSKPYYLRLYQCVSSKFTQSFKLTDFMMPELDFAVFANASGQVYSASYPEVG